LDLSPSLPGLRFRLLGFPVTIGVDFLLITVLIGLGNRPGLYLLEWLVVVAVSILIHELGHALALRQYNINAEIRLWGMGGLTIFGFALPPRKSILVSLAGPLIGIPVAVMVMVFRPWLPNADPWQTVASDLIFVNLWWGIVNLLPLAGLDGGHVTTNLFLVAFGERGRRPGLILVAITSIAIAAVAALFFSIYLTVVILFFALFNPEPYLALWRLLTGGRRSGGSVPSGYGGRAQAPAPLRGQRQESSKPKVNGKSKDRPAPAIIADSRRVYGEAYAEVVSGSSGADVDTLDLESRPAPLLPDVIRMVAAGDDAGVAARLATEPDPLAALGIVTRVVEAKRVPQVRTAVGRLEGTERIEGLTKLQVALHALGRFEDSVLTAAALGHAGDKGSAVLEARSAARLGDKKRTAAALERALDLGASALSESALGDIARVGPDARVGAALARLRSASFNR
jgi:stage IV sporulation protein FB